MSALWGRGGRGEQEPLRPADPMPAQGFFRSMSGNKALTPRPNTGRYAEDANAEEVVVRFDPSRPLGFRLEGSSRNTRIEEVTKDSQAEQKGVKIHWTIYKINNREYFGVDQLKAVTDQAARESGREFTVTFKATSLKMRNSWTIVFGWLKWTFIPALLFMGASILFMVGYHQNPRLLLGGVLFLVFAILTEVAWLYNSKSRMTKEVLGIATYALALACGAMVGTSLHLTDLHDYWPYYQKRHYTNVAPDEMAAAHTDASVLVFMEGARPDGARFAGYWRYGSVYCVAPIATDSSYMDGAATEDTVSNNIQYWAIGKNCCGGVQGFHCDDSQNPLARSGLVMTKKTEEDTLLQGIISNDDMSYYEEAVLMSLSKFDLTSPKERLYVRYVKDIEQARYAYWWAAWWHWGKYQMVWLMVWMFTGAMVLVVGVGDREDDCRYNDHMADFKQSFLHGLNHYI